MYLLGTIVVLGVVLTGCSQPITSKFNFGVTSSVTPESTSRTSLVITDSANA